jgi:hypothetical protein
MLASLMVLMAVALEGIKPLAVASAFSAFGCWAIIRGVALSILAMVAIAYSLTSELALVAGTRGDLAAKRASVIERNGGRLGRIEAAQSELATLAPSRTVAEVRAEITKLMAENPRAGDCTALDGPVSRTVCSIVATLNAEISRTERRAELQATIAKLIEATPVVAAKAADPASSALATYLSAIGIAVPVGLLSEWLVLVPVLALEVGAALAIVLVQAVSDVRRVEEVKRVVEQKQSVQQGEARADTKSRSSPGDQAPKHAMKRTHAKARKRTRGRDDKGGSGGQKGKRFGNVVDLLKAKGGQIRGGQRGIAKSLELSKSRVNEMLHELAAAGAVRLKTARSGTTVALVAG